MSGLTCRCCVVGRILHRDLVDMSFVPDAKGLDVDIWHPHRKATGGELWPVVRAATLDIVEVILTIVLFRQPVNGSWTPACTRAE